METITQINDKITHDITLTKRRAKREMTKKGFVNVDGTIMQYNPLSSNFTTITNENAVKYFRFITGTLWGTGNSRSIIEYLQNELPQISKTDVNAFNSYIEQSKIHIDEDLINDLMKQTIQENDIYKNPKAVLKGKLNLQSELIALRNNDIYTDGLHRLYCLTDGEFKPVKSNDILVLFKKTIGTEDTKLVPQYVKNHWHSYVESLTNVKKLLFYLRQKEHKAKTLTDAEPGFKNVLEVISSYGGK